MGTIPLNSKSDNTVLLIKKSGALNITPAVFSDAVDMPFGMAAVSTTLFT